MYEFALLNLGDYWFDIESILLSIGLVAQELSAYKCLCKDSFNCIIKRCIKLLTLLLHD